MVEIIIVGGGFAGQRLARGLSWKHKVTVIDAKDYFELVPSNTRALVEPKQTYYTILLHPKGTVVGEVTEITENSDAKGAVVKLKDGRTYKGDYVIVTAGSFYDSPAKADLDAEGTSAARKSNLTSFALKIKEAEHITVIGGGSTGIEIAGDILDVHPGKKLTYITGSSGFVPDFPEAARAYVDAFFAKKGVEVIKERCTLVDATTVKTDSGREIKTGLVIKATGTTPAAARIKIVSSSGATIDTKRGLETDRTLKVKGSSVLYATGDSTRVDMGEGQQAFNIGTIPQGNVAARVIIANLTGKGPVVFPKKVPFAGFITIGSKDGVGVDPAGSIKYGAQVPTMKGFVGKFQSAIATGWWLPKFMYETFVEGMFGKPEKA